MFAKMQRSRKPSSRNLAWNVLPQVGARGDLVITKHHKVYSPVGDMITGERVEHMAFPDTPGTNRENGAVLTQQDSKLVKASNIPKPDGLQELLQLAREFESEEVSQGNSHRKFLTHNGELQQQGFAQELKEESPAETNRCTLCHRESRLTNGALEDIENHKEDEEFSSHSDGFRPKRDASEKEEGSSCSLSDEIFDLKGDQSSQKNMDYGGATSVNGFKSLSLASHTAGQSRFQCTIPQPFSFATDKRHRSRGCLQDVEAQPSHKSLGMNGTFADMHLRTAEISKKSAPKLIVEKALCSECAKNHEDSSKKLSFHATSEHCDDNLMLIRSCSAVPKAKASKCTSSNSFKFHSESRAEKRKEYYTKLQERLIAKEEEMNLLQAKAEKDREEELKLLRKGLKFRAHPVPSFYQEGPPQKADLPKTPTTRAKSPNFSRRESNFRGSTRYCSLKCQSDHGTPQKLGNRRNMDHTDHEHCCKHSFEKRLSARFSEGNSLGTPESGSELLDAEFSLNDSEDEDILVKGQDPLIVCSELMRTDKEEKVEPQRIHAISNGVEPYHDGVTLTTSAQTSLAFDSSAKFDDQVQATKVLQGQSNGITRSFTSALNNTAEDSQPAIHEDREDLLIKEGYLSDNVKQNKAKTPS